MARRTSRRRLLAGLGAGGLAGLAGCAGVTDVFPESGRPGDVPQSPTGEVQGRVRDTEGTAVADATVTALGVGGTRLARTTTDTEGRFELEVARPVWLRTRAAGYQERVVAAAPGTRAEPVLVDARDTATLTLGGDVMFGRRFHEPSGDDLNPRLWIRRERRRRDHDRVLAPVTPALEAADLTSLNLESPLTTRGLRHPEKRYTFVSHPVAAEALADAGVDHVALGNNHAFDALTPGLRDTVGHLDGAGVAHSGAGLDTGAAWQPATTEVGGLRVAVVSCSDVVGGRYDLHWSADREAGRPTTVREGGRSTTVAAGVGVAEAGVDRLARRVTAARSAADVVVVQIHGGEQYVPAPTDRLRRLVGAATDAGADLVACHHPHVLGGIERRGGAVVAWSLGNLVFDQTLWPTFPTALLTAAVTADGVVRATFDPLLVDGFVPHGVVGKPRRVVAGRAAGLSGPDARHTGTGLALGAGTDPPETTRLSLEGPAIHAGPGGWVRGVEAGTVRLGRDLLPTGTFESVDIDGTGYDGPLWRFARDPPASAAGFGVGDGGGVRLRRLAGNSANVVLSNGRRVPVDGPLTLAARYRTGAARGLTLDVAWYDDTAGPALSRQTRTLPATDGWTVLTRDLTPPPDATHANVLFVLSPPETGRRTAHVDDVRLLTWAPPSVDGGREYDHLRVGTAAGGDRHRRGTCRPPARLDPPRRGLRTHTPWPPPSRAVHRPGLSRAWFRPHGPRR